MSIQFHKFKVPEKDYAGFNRRMFLKSSAMVGITTAALLGGVGSAFASNINDEQKATLLQMVQDIYPHPDRLTIDHYQAVVDALLAEAGNNQDKADGLIEGLAKIEASSIDLHGVKYIEIQEQDAREGLLRQFQNEGFFQGIRWTAYFAIYNNKDVWPLLGYEGSSVEHGGYIDRGFSDITFVPQGPSLKERMAAVENSGE